MLQKITADLTSFLLRSYKDTWDAYNRSLPQRHKVHRRCKDSADKVLKAVTDKIRNNHYKQPIEILSGKILKSQI